MFFNFMIRSKLRKSEGLGLGLNKILILWGKVLVQVQVQVQVSSASSKLDECAEQLAGWEFFKCKFKCQAQAPP
jgi:hypothetical protein